MRSLLIVAVVGHLFGCHKDAGTSSPSAPASTKDQDALWALAPAGTKVGIVASPRGVKLLEEGALALKEWLAVMPELAAAKAKLEAELVKRTGSATVTLAELGLSHDKGAALFVVDGDGELVIVPLGDRDKFLALSKGQKGSAADTIGDHTCKTVGSVYACAKPADLLERIGKGKDSPSSKLSVAGPRGDLELVASSGSAGKPPMTVAVTAQLGRGAIVMHGGVAGLPATIAAQFNLGKPHKPRVDADSSSGFAIVDLQGVLAKLPPQPVVPGVTLASLGTSINGPITMTVPAGETMIDMRIPLGDPAPAKALVEQCASFPPLAMVGAKVKNGVCHVPVPQYGLELEAWVEGQELRIGKKTAPSHGKSVALGGAGRELATGEWSLAMFGRGTVLGLPAIPGLPTPLPSEAAAAIRGLSMLNEMGLGLRLDGDTLHFYFDLRTAWANPDDVVAKLQAITSEQILSGKTGEVAKAIAESSPSSPFAADARAGYAGLMVPTAIVGVLAAVAVPAFMEYMKKSKQSEASLRLNRLSKNLKIAYATNASFPKGDAPLTPSTPCCAGPNGRCVADPAAWQQPVWQALDFEVDEPALFQYAYHSDGKTFEARAVGDLDCDGVAITYVLSGSAPNGEVTTVLTEPPPSSD